MDILLEETDLGEEYEVLVVGLNADGDEIPHEHRLFCDDMTCPDKEDQEHIAILNGWVTDGFLTSSEADQYYCGRTI